MRYGSVCSGIEAATVAWEPLGWEAQFFSEIEPFPCSVLKHHYPKVPNLGDMTKYKEWPDAAIDVLVGGTPCQSFSVAGLRKGLADPRGNLMLTFGAIASKYRPRWILWENVPGVLSSNNGRDFGTFLGMLGQLGYGFAYRVLDAQYVRVESHRRAVPQRRRRVFVVGYLGDWRRAAAVLFERESMSGHSPPSREAGERVAPTVTNGPPFSRTGNERVEAEATIAVNSVAGCMEHQSHGGITTQAALSGYIQPVAFAQNTRDEVRLLNGDGKIAGTLAAEPGMKQQTYVAQSIGWSEELTAHHELAGTLQYGGQGGRHDGVMTPDMSVRRLTPVECERLQGFPDNYTLVPHNGKPAADGPRYKALGNSMATNCMRWIGERIDMVEGL